ncbi:DUF2019 domain-containing protein [Nitratireductor sp. GISD-1A_MAKvit]|uniref:DUF2019 domain-containing protein n=1 Tax=Nitratireductor sp. GISD-1A_MAKvit TaxID=3234198 RepID=UPI00346724B6
MTVKKRSELSVDQIIRRFIDLSLTQHEAVLYLETRPYNRAYLKIKGLAEELEARPGDQRHVLVDLFDHPNPQVRLNAATYAHPLFPDPAIKVVQSIIDAKRHPQEADARTVLDYLINGPLEPE